MSLGNVGREEECFEYDYQDEERKPTSEQHESLDFLEEGKFCTLFKLTLSLLVSKYAWLLYSSHGTL